MSRYNYLSENSCTSSDCEFANAAKIKSLVGYRIKTKLDQRLLNLMVWKKKK